MRKLNVLYIKLDTHYGIIDYSKQLKELVNIDNCTMVKFTEALAAYIRPRAAALTDGHIESMIFMCNHKVECTHTDNALFFFYANIKYENSAFLIKITNWLDWLHNLSQSMENGYKFFETFNKNVCRSKFKTVSGICSFKALYPLLMHVPRKFKTNHLAIYDIIRVFVRKGDDANISKDYSRNVLSRLQTSLRRETGALGLNLSDLIKDDDLLLSKHPWGIYIANTALKNHMLYPACDDLLNCVLQLAHC